MKAIITTICFLLLATPADAARLRYTGQAPVETRFFYGAGAWSPTFDFVWDFDVYTGGAHMSEYWATARHEGVVPFDASGNTFFEGVITMDTRGSDEELAPLTINGVGEFMRQYPIYNVYLDGTFTVFGVTYEVGDYVSGRSGDRKDCCMSFAVNDWDFGSAWPESITLRENRRTELQANGMLTPTIPLRLLEFTSQPETTLERAPITGDTFLDWQRTYEDGNDRLTLRAWEFYFGTMGKVGSAPGYGDPYPGIGAVPEPESWGLIAVGLLACWVFYRAGRIDVR